MRLIDPRLPDCRSLEIAGLDDATAELLMRWWPPFLATAIGGAPDSLLLRVTSGTGETHRYVADDGTMHLHLAGEPAHRALAVLAVARATFKAEAAACGYANVHAATLQRSGHGVLVTADRGAGKTTLMLAALRQGFDFISNDQAMVGGRNGEWVALGWPALTAVRESTVRQLGLPEGESVMSLADPVEPGRRILYAPETLCRIMGSRMLPATPVAMVVDYLRDEAADHVALAADPHGCDALTFPLCEALGEYNYDLIRRFVGDFTEPTLDTRVSAFRLRSPWNAAREAAAAIARALDEL